ncbi:hypothetical protein [Flavobacterium anhuiense]|nr:hypothetical protein [Flavobacterium anhuiense]
MNIDPLAEKYSNLSMYTYSLNNPVYFLDPNGMEIINGDQVKKKEIDEKIKTKNQYIESQLAKMNLSGLSESKLKKKLTDSQFKSYKNMQKEIKSLTKESKELDIQSKKTNDKINELKKEAPELYNKMNSLSVDIYWQSSDYIHNNDGQNNTSFENSDPKNVSLRSSFGSNSTTIVTGNTPSGDRTTLEVSKHEFGHADYIIENTQSYYEWLINNKINLQKHDGHKNNDPSGQRADEYTNKDFKSDK